MGLVVAICCAAVCCIASGVLYALRYHARASRPQAPAVLEIKSTRSLAETAPIARPNSFSLGPSTCGGRTLEVSRE